MPLDVVRAGSGPRIVLVHGSAADHTTWTIQLASPALRDRFELLAYDRGAALTVEDGADELATVIGDAGALLAVGSSFGAVIVLDLLRRHPGRVRGAVLCEPPMVASEDQLAAQQAFVADLDARAASAGGEAAAEQFLRTVLGDAAFERMPRAFQDRSRSHWRAIRADSHALSIYRPRYDDLSSITTPVLLVGGDRSAPYFRPTLDRLLASLPHARLELVAGGHMLHADAHRRFAELLVAFAEEVGVV